MKIDPFMLEFFLKEARDHCASLLSLSRGEIPVSDAIKAVISLKGAAKILGLNKYALLCEKIENFLSKTNGATKFNSSFSFAIEVLSDCVKSEPNQFEETISECESKIDEALASDFLAEDISISKSISDGAVSQVVSDDSLPPIEASMKPLFLEETKNQLNVLSSTLIELEGDFSNSKKLEKLMRASHSLKGAARVVALSDIVAFTHELENCFVAAQEAKIHINSNTLDLFLECTDFIGELCESDFLTMNRSRYFELFENLKKVAIGTYGEKTQVRPKAVPLSTVEKRTRVKGDSFVRVSAKSLNALMELSAEILVENRRIEFYRESFASIKETQERIARQLESAMNTLEASRGADVAVARLEQLRKSMRSLSELSREQTESLGEFSRRNVMLSGRLYAEVLASRMRPFSDGITIFPRLVRDLAKEAGKKISFEIHGKDVPVDRDVLEKLESPITHLLRNACDHGIEKPDVRIAKGKPEIGKVLLSAWHSSGFLMVSIKDDGAGLNELLIRRKILGLNLVSADILEKMSADEVFEFLFLPNFTTKEDVTHLSGRGVGLDVVQSMLRDVGGSISVKNKGGAEFILKLPIARSVIKTLTVSIDNEPYAFPLGRVYRASRISQNDVSTEDGHRTFLLDGEKVRLFSTSEILGLERSRQVRQSDEIYAIVASNKLGKFAFEVDNLPSEAELVVRPLNATLGKIPCVSSASLDEDGLPVLILDVDDLLAYAEKFFERGSLSIEDIYQEETTARKKILVVDDSATVRETQRKILEAAGYAVETAVDGMDGWNSFRFSQYDIVVSDVDMPRMTGFELVEKIRSVDSKIPVVIVSYKDRTEDRTKGKSAGANVYLTKSSFQDDSFLRTIRELIK